jgi:hypothetical protein
MGRGYVVLGLVLGVALFAFFVPITYVPPHYPCVHGCPPESQYGSLTYVILGHGGYSVGYFPFGRYSVW